MKKLLIMPVLAVVLFAAACGEDDGDPTAVETMASVRFFNAVTGMAGNGGFTANGQFATGSALAFGLSTPTCMTLDAGSASFGFGAANASGTALSGSVLATLNNQSMTSGGNYSVAAAGPAATPTLYLLNNNFSGSLTSSQAAVRFVNLSLAAANPFNVLSGTVGSGTTTVVATNITAGSASPYITVTSGAIPFSILHGQEVVITGTPGTLNLPAGSISTVAILPSASGGYQLVNIPRC